MLQESKSPKEVTPLATECTDAQSKENVPTGDSDTAPANMLTASENEKPALPCTHTDISDKYMPPGIETSSKNGLESLTCVLNKLLDKSQSPLSSLQEPVLAQEVVIPKKKQATLTKASDLLKMFHSDTYTATSPRKVTSCENGDLNIYRNERKHDSELKINHEEPLDLSIKQEEIAVKTEIGKDGALDLTKRSNGTSSLNSAVSRTDEPVSFLRKLEEKFGNSADDAEATPKKNHKHHTLPSFSTNVFTAALYNMKPMATTDLVYRKELKQLTSGGVSPKEKLPRAAQETQSSPNSFIDKSMKILQRRSGDAEKLVPPKLTAFVCECKKEFDTLYNLTIHIQETNHMPKKHKTITSDYPKLVRGQDMWLTQGSEQTRQILRCMQCGESFKSLPELTVHMMQTRHYAKIMSTDSQRPTRPLSPSLSDETLGETLSPINYDESAYSGDKSFTSYSERDFTYSMKPYDSSPDYKFSNTRMSITPESDAESAEIKCDKCFASVPSAMFTQHVQDCVKIETNKESNHRDHSTPPALIHVGSPNSCRSASSKYPLDRNSNTPQLSHSVSNYLSFDDKEPTESSTSTSALAAMEKFVTQRFDASSEKESKRPTLSDAISSFPLNPTFQFPKSKPPESPRSEKLRNYISSMFSGLPNSTSDNLSKEEKSSVPSTCTTTGHDFHSDTSGPLNLCLPKYMESMPKTWPPKLDCVPEPVKNNSKADEKEKNLKESKKTNNLQESLETSHNHEGIDSRLEEKYLRVKEEEDVEPIVNKKSDGSALESLKGMVYGHSFTTEHPLDSLQKLIHDSVQQRTTLPMQMPESPVVRNNSVSPYSQAGPSTFILVNPIVTVLSPSGMQVSRNAKTPSSDSDDVSPLKASTPKFEKKESLNHEEKENNNILCKNCGKTYSSMSYRYHTTWCNIASTQIQQKLELKEALHFSPYIYMPLDHTSGNSPQKSHKSPAQSPQSAEPPPKRIKKDPDTSPASKFHKYYQMADELAKKK